MMIRAESDRTRTRREGKGFGIHEQCAIGFLRPCSSSAPIGRITFKGALWIQDPDMLPLSTTFLAVSGNERTMTSHKDADSMARCQTIQRRPLEAVKKAPNRGPRLGAVFVLQKISCSRLRLSILVGYRLTRMRWCPHKTPFQKRLLGPKRLRKRLRRFLRSA